MSIIRFWNESFENGTFASLTACSLPHICRTMSIASGLINLFPTLKTAFIRAIRSKTAYDAITAFLDFWRNEFSGESSLYFFKLASFFRKNSALSLDVSGCFDCNYLIKLLFFRVSFDRISMHITHCRHSALLLSRTDVNPRRKTSDLFSFCIFKFKIRENVTLLTISQNTKRLKKSHASHTKQR